ncbi:hypothetical protein [Ectobacillus ponti]|uniref:Uncharacterized protein n=1 Tax=Ectobacillus ponti TaxID=2961894 RepID=A0AA41XDK3_9BACI|nr:hypothetical protein [Ectobacillus ponti]MCP8970141.1 hypothetical protein [Ectobacillus ponti]
MTSPIYQLDTVLSKRYIEGACSERLQDYPQLGRLLAKYRRLLAQWHDAPAAGSTYERTIEFSSGDYYVLRWSVERTLESIRQTPLSLSVPALLGVLDAEACLEEGPVILVHHPFLAEEAQHILISGGRRILQYAERGAEAIEAYVLAPEQHYPALQTPLDQLLYLIHGSIVALMNYMEGHISEEELQEFLDQTTAFE